MISLILQPYSRLGTHKNFTEYAQREARLDTVGTMQIRVTI